MCNFIVPRCTTSYAADHLDSDQSCAGLYYLQHEGTLSSEDLHAINRRDWIYVCFLLPWLVVSFVDVPNNILTLYTK